MLMEEVGRLNHHSSSTTMVFDVVNLTLLSLDSNHKEYRIIIPHALGKHKEKLNNREGQADSTPVDEVV